MSCALAGADARHFRTDALFGLMPIFPFMDDEPAPRAADGSAQGEPAPRLEVVIEIPRGSFLKRGSTGQIDFVSPLPCPFNYGSVPAYLGLEGDLLDAVVLGPRLPRGTRISVRAFGAVGMADRGMYDDKLICSPRPLTASERKRILAFFRFYARSKALLNLLRGQPGRTGFVGWREAHDAIARARPLAPGEWQGPPVSF
jgi:inorganic pyrophosphatase